MTCQWLAFDPCIVLNFLMPSRMLNRIGKFKHPIYNTLWLRQLKSVTWLVHNFESGRNFGNRLEETSKYDHPSAQLLCVDYSSGFGWMWLGFVGHIFPNQHWVNILSHFQLFLWQMFIFYHSKFAGHVPCAVEWYPGPRLNIKTIFSGMGIPMLKIRRSVDRLIFNIGMPILVRQHLYIEMPPSSPMKCAHSLLWLPSSL